MCTRCQQQQQSRVWWVRKQQAMQTGKQAPVVFLWLTARSHLSGCSHFEALNWVPSNSGKKQSVWRGWWRRSNSADWEGNLLYWSNLGQQLHWPCWALLWLIGAREPITFHCTMWRVHRVHRRKGTELFTVILWLRLREDWSLSSKNKYCFVNKRWSLVLWMWHGSR